VITAEFGKVVALSLVAKCAEPVIVLPVLLIVVYLAFCVLFLVLSQLFFSFHDFPWYSGMFVLYFLSNFVSRNLVPSFPCSILRLVRVTRDIEANR
jgi:hypothetical protein